MNRKLYLCLPMITLMLMQGCSSTSSVPGGSKSSSITGCPEKPTTELRIDNIKPLNFTDQPLEISGFVSQKSIGYQFSGKSGQTIQYKTDQEICIWIYSPDNQLLKSEILPVDGNYIVQIEKNKKEQDFKLVMGLDINLAPEKSISSNQSPVETSNNSFSQEEFPKDTCGDGKPSYSNITSIQFYPVNIPYSPENLELVRSNFCQDAYQKRDKSTGEKLIQMSSFTDQGKAQEFVQFINTKISGASVGQPTTVYLGN